MNERLNQWLWILDEELVRALLSAQPESSSLAKRAATHPAVVSAMRNWMQNDAERALADLRQPVTQGNADALQLAAHISFEKGDTAQAAEYYARLADSVSGHPYATLNLGLCQVRMGQWEQAIDSLQRAVVLQPGSPEAWFVLGASLLNAQRLPEARAAFGQSQKLKPGYVPAVCGEAATLQLMGLNEEALAIWERLIEFDSSHIEILTNAANAAIAIENLTRARELAESLLQISPDSPAALFALAQVSLKEERFDEAAGYCQKLAEANPASFDHWYNLGVCYQRLGRHQDAAFAFDNSLRLDATDAEAWQGLAVALAATGDRPSAKTAWQMALQCSPQDSQGWLQLGLLQCADREIADAESSLNVAQKAGLSTGEPPEAFTELKNSIAVLHHEEGDLTRAAELYRQVLEVAPESAQVRFNLGSALVAMGRTQEGQECWKAAVAEHPELGKFLLSQLSGAGPEPVPCA